MSDSKEETTSKTIRHMELPKIVRCSPETEDSKEKTIPCQYIIQRGIKKGEMCGNDSIPCQYYCRLCETKTFSPGQNHSKDFVYLIGNRKYYPKYFVPSTGYVVNMEKTFVIGILFGDTLRELTDIEIEEAKTKYNLDYDYDP